MVRRRPRVAVLGGDGRFRSERLPGCTVRIFRARRYAGSRSLRDLERSIRAGGIDRVLILARWNGHSTTRRVTSLCRKRNIPVEIIP